jgi:hypothetical protein
MKVVEFQDSTSGAVVSRACPGEHVENSQTEKKEFVVREFRESMIIYSKNDSKASIHTRVGA